MSWVSWDPRAALTPPLTPFLCTIAQVLLYSEEKKKAQAWFGETPPSGGSFLLCQLVVSALLQDLQFA
jgi:hypothetical protein